MTAFDFDATRRWARFEPNRTLARRDDAELAFVDPGQIAGQALLLDTCVYIDQMRGRTPAVLDDIIARRQVNHSTVAIQELMHSVGVLQPSDPRTAGVVAEIGAQIKAMPPYRVFAPDADVLGRAALLSGSCVGSRVMARTASCARYKTVSCSCRRRSWGWWYSRRISATTISCCN